MFSRLVAGWANHLDDYGARLLIDGITVPSLPEAGGAFEGVTRMLWGLGAWLSQPGRPTTLTWRGAAYDVAALMKRALVNGCDPECPSNWGWKRVPGFRDQHTVETGNTIFNLWQARETVWASMSPVERQNVIGYHELHSPRPPAWGNNWSLFWLTNHASRRALGEQHNLELIDSILDEYIDRAYIHDGWNDDGFTRGANEFDDYNWWVFTSHQLMWVMADGDRRPDRRDVILDRVRQLMVHYPYFFGEDGSYTEYGRSLSYKFSRLGAPLFAYKLGSWPYSDGMLKRLVGRHLRWYFDRGAVNADGILIQPLTFQGNEGIRDPYIATGSVYWAMQAFCGLWSIPDDDPFWSAEEEPLPVEQADFVKVFPQPGWVVVGTKDSGMVQRFNGGSSHGDLSTYNARYGKYVYATAAPFNSGLAGGEPAPDGMLCLSDGQRYGHRSGNLAWAVGEPGWLRMRYTERAAGLEHKIDTTIVCWGEVHLRAHRVTLNPTLRAPLFAVEGAAALGYSPGMGFEQASLPAECASAGWLTIEEDRRHTGRGVAIRGLRGYSAPSLTTAWQGHTNLNSVFREYALPLLEVRPLEPVHELVCLVHIGQDETLPQIYDMQASAEWLPDGSLNVTAPDGTVIIVPAPG